MPHTKSPKKPTMTSAAIAKADFRKKIFNSIILGILGTLVHFRHSVFVVPFDIFLQRFSDFIYLTAKGLLTPEEPENVYKNN
jgi:hypothetical protein